MNECTPESASEWKARQGITLFNLTNFSPSAATQDEEKEEEEESRGGRTPQGKVKRKKITPKKKRQRSGWPASCVAASFISRRVFFFRIVRFLKIAFGNKGLRLGFSFPICEMEIVAAALLGGWEDKSEVTDDKRPAEHLRAGKRCSWVLDRVLELPGTSRQALNDRR